MLVDQLGPSAWGTILTALVRYRQLEVCWSSNTVPTTRSTSEL